MNTNVLIQKISQVRFMGLVTLMKKLKVGQKHENKMWFFKINSFLKNENLRLYSLPVNAVIRNLENNNLMKLPDPRDFVIGMNFLGRNNISSKTKNKSGNLYKKIKNSGNKDKKKAKYKAKRYFNEYK